MGDDGERGDKGEWSWRLAGGGVMGVAGGEADGARGGGAALRGGKLKD
jgi:hypothetical protein